MRIAQKDIKILPKLCIRNYVHSQEIASPSTPLFIFIAMWKALPFYGRGPCSLFLQLPFHLWKGENKQCQKPAVAKKITKFKKVLMNNLGLCETWEKTYV
ncbi:MAG: hypothetical protein KatS3mg027_0253 [Bacteroidia bacterium]|nr:MAG: hypothetical protein KatS3mg027_0253 [Bacteroidia bacterium]